MSAKLPTMSPPSIRAGAIPERPPCLAGKSIHPEMRTVVFPPSPSPSRSEAGGLECVLADARQVKNLPGRPKRDPSDSDGAKRRRPLARAR